MGKWSHLETATDEQGRPKYQEAPPSPNEAYNTRVFSRVDELSRLEFKALADVYEAAYQEEERAEAVKKAASFETEAAERALLRKMRDLGMERVSINGRSLTPSVEPYANTIDKAALIEFMIRTQPLNLLVHHGTLSSLVKQAISGEAEMPPGVDVFLKKRLLRPKSK